MHEYNNSDVVDAQVVGQKESPYAHKSLDEIEQLLFRDKRAFLNKMKNDARHTAKVLERRRAAKVNAKKARRANRRKK